MYLQGYINTKFIITIITITMLHDNKTIKGTKNDTYIH